MGGQTRNAGGGTDDSRCGDDVVCYEDFPVPLVQEAAASFLNACCIWFFKSPCSRSRWRHYSDARTRRSGTRWVAVVIFPNRCFGGIST